MIEWPSKALYLTHEEYSRILDKWGELSRIKPDGSFDDTQWTAWVMREFHLEPYTTYTVKLTRLGLAPCIG